jgi:hypothetical protein
MARGFCPEIRVDPSVTAPCYAARAIHCESRSFITRWFLCFPVGQVDHQSAFSAVAPFEKKQSRDCPHAHVIVSCKQFHAS